MLISSRRVGVPQVCPKCAPAHSLYLSDRVCPCAPPPKGGHTGHTDRGHLANHSKRPVCAPIPGAQS
jgi:hypothetical protein